MTRFERWSVWITSIATGVTGIALGWVKYLVPSGDPWAVVNSPWQPVMLKLHIIAAPLLVFAIGLITLRHVWQHVRSRVRVGRRTGLGTAAAVVPMVFTGYLIQAVTHVGWLAALAWTHVGTGLLYLVALALHQLVVPRERRRRGAPGRDHSGASGIPRERNRRRALLETRGHNR